MPLAAGFGSGGRGTRGLTMYGKWFFVTFGPIAVILLVIALAVTPWAAIFAVAIAPSTASRGRPSCTAAYPPEALR